MNNYTRDTVYFFLKLNTIIILGVIAIIFIENKIYYKDILDLLNVVIDYFYKVVIAELGLYYLIKYDYIEVDSTERNMTLTKHFVDKYSSRELDRYDGRNKEYLVKYSSPVISFKMSIETENSTIVITAPKFLIKRIERLFRYVKIGN